MQLRPLPYFTHDLISYSGQIKSKLKAMLLNINFLVEPPQVGGRQSFGGWVIFCFVFAFSFLWETG